MDFSYKSIIAGGSLFALGCGAMACMDINEFILGCLGCSGILIGQTLLLAGVATLPKFQAKDKQK